MSTWNNEDIELVKKFIDIRNRGLYADGTQVTDAYNRILNRNLRPTNCGSCIRQRVNELETELNRMLRKMEITAKKEEEAKLAEQKMEETNDATQQGTPEKKPTRKKSGKQSK